MALSQERLGEIAVLVLLDKLQQDGITLKPKEIRREVVNRAKKLNVPGHEMAEFAQFLLEKVYTSTVHQLVPWIE